MLQYIETWARHVDVKATMVACPSSDIVIPRDERAPGLLPVLRGTQSRTRRVALLVACSLSSRFLTYRGSKNTKRHPLALGAVAKEIQIIRCRMR